MKISIVIPNYNGENLIRKNFPKIVKAISQYEYEKEIIIVDDASTDNSIETIEAQKETIKNDKVLIKIIVNSHNLGFSSTVNRGVKESDGSIIVLLNTDVIPENIFLDPIIDDFKDDKVFGVGFLDKSIEEKQTIFRGRGIGRWERGFLVHAKGSINKSNSLWASGGSSAFKKELWEKMGGFCELYNPFYWEDIDLSYRALKSGYKILFEAKSVVIHEHEKGSIKSIYSFSDIQKIAYKNQFLFVWLNITDVKLIISHLFWLPFHFFKAAISLNFPFFTGFIAALINFPKIVKFKSASKKYFIFKDKEIINSVKE